MTLQQEIDERRQSIRTDSYAMSIGEFATLYRDGELFLHPEYQRLFRWTPYQKSRPIESLLLGIPVPSLFVAQRADGVWDVIDGLQRLSTVFEFMGELKDANDKLLPALELLPTHYLPSLKGKTWTGDNEDHCFTREQQLLLKRAKFDVRIMFIGEGNATKSPFDLFDRSTLADPSFQIKNSGILSSHPNRRLFRIGSCNCRVLPSFRSVSRLPIINARSSMTLSLLLDLWCSAEHRMQNSPRSTN